MLKSSMEKIEWFEHSHIFFYPVQNVDALVNILFFVPLGIIIFNIRNAYGKRWNILIDLILAIIAGLLLSSVIEFLQLLLQERRTSVVDLLRNIIGSLTGVLLIHLLRRLFSAATFYKLTYFYKKIPIALLLLPLLFATTVLSEKVTRYFLYQDKIGNSLFNWQYIVKPVWIWQTIFLSIPIGILVNRLMHRYISHAAPFIRYIISLILVLIILGMTEWLNFVIYKNHLVQIKMVYRLLGLITGITIGEILKIELSLKSSGGHKRILSILFATLILMYSLLFFKFTYPYAYNFKSEFISSKILFTLLSVRSFIPFGEIQKLLVYSLSNILLFAPIGILIKEIEFYLPIKNRNRVILLISTTIIIFPLCIQIFNPDQIALLFQLPTNALGILSGYFFWKGVRIRGLHNPQEVSQIRWVKRQK
jgi:glycopeptide antibiotics resistance protein